MIGRTPAPRAEPYVGARPWRRGRRDALTAYAMILPALVFLAVLVFYPALSTLWTSLTSYDLHIPFTRVVGLANYAEDLTSSDFWSSVLRSFIVVAITLPLDLGIGLVAALVVNEKFVGRGLVRTLLIVPWMLPPIVNGFMWGWLLNGDYGALNGLLYQLHVIHHYVQWLASPTLQLVWVSVAQAWTRYPFAMLLILAGLQGIPDEVYAAARVDGAGSLRLFRSVTFPLLMPSFLIALVVEFIATFQIFDVIWSLTSGGAAGTTINPFTQTLMIYNYAVVFRDLRIGVGSSVAYLVLLLSLGVGFIFIRLLGVREET